MAVSSTTAAVYISRKTFAPPSPRNSIIFSNSSVAFASKPRTLFIRSSGETSAETAPTEAEESETSIEAPKGPPSLISTLNVERALRGIPITDVDYYGRLGLERGCSYEQVDVAYRNKVDELLNRGLDGEELAKEMELLKESYAILSTREERRMYDWSLARSDAPERYTWPYEEDISPPSNRYPPQEPEDVGPTRLVGYFFLGWLILSFVLSVVLNR